MVVTLLVRKYVQCDILVRLETEKGAHPLPDRISACGVRGLRSRNEYPETHEGFTVLRLGTMQFFELRAVNKNVWFSFGDFRTEPQESGSPKFSRPRASDCGAGPGRLSMLTSSRKSWTGTRQ